MASESGGGTIVIASGLAASIFASSGSTLDILEAEQGGWEGKVDGRSFGNLVSR